MEILEGDCDVHCDKLSKSPKLPPRMSPIFFFLIPVQHLTPPCREDLDWLLL